MEYISVRMMHANHDKASSLPITANVKLLCAFVREACERCVATKHASLGLVVWVGEGYIAMSDKMENFIWRTLYVS